MSSPSHQAGGFTCVEVFFFRTGQNWGNRAYFPKADRTLGPGEVLGAFLAQFYDDKPCPRCVFISHDIEERALLAEALSTKSGHKVEIAVPQRGEKKDLVEHALANAREALGRKLAETSSQQKLLRQLAETFGLPRVPRRIEVYDNSHIQGTNAVGAMIVAGAGRLSQKPVPQVQHPLGRARAGRRFRHDARGAGAALQAADRRGAAAGRRRCAQWRADRRAAGADAGSVDEPEDDSDAESPWPDLVLIDGGQGQLNAARETLAALGVRCAAGRASPRARTATPGARPSSCRAARRSSCRRAIRCSISSSGCATRRIASPSARTGRAASATSARPACRRSPASARRRKRALLHHFGTLKAIERASLADLAAGARHQRRDGAAHLRLLP